MTAITQIYHRMFAAVKSAAFSFLQLFAGNSETRCQKKLMLHLQYLTSNIFTCLVADDYADMLYLYERRIHKEKINCLAWMALLQKYRSCERESKCFSLLIDLGQIRRRVTDHATFRLCQEDLLALESALIAFMSQWLSGSMAEVAARLNRCTDQFEDTFHHVLNIAGREPVVFVLFIGALRELQALAVRESNDD